MSNHSIERIVNAESSTLYIFFGGLAGGLAMPPFEFFKSAKLLDDNIIFVRDISQNWYQSGVKDISTDVEETVDFFKNEITRIAPKKIFFVGNSMGGYAAIMFASLLQNQSVKVIAFSPQTFIHPFLRLKYRDFRWQSTINKTYLKSFKKSSYYDLNSLLNKLSINIDIDIYVSKKDKLDTKHAQYLANTTQVKVISYNQAGHGLVRHLRNEGLLVKILKRNQ